MNQTPTNQIAFFSGLGIFFSLMFLSGIIKAQVYTMSNGTFTTCSGTFYDSGGGSGNYGNNENLTITFCPGSPASYLKVKFDSVGISSNDILYVYDGASISAKQLGVFSNVSCMDEFVSSIAGGCLTFRFISNSSTVNSGWKASISCAGTPSTKINMHNDSLVTCGGTFYDSGGPNCDYIPNENYTLTICPDQAGKFLKVDFDTISLPSNDLLYVYDGPGTSAPVLGIFSNFNCIDEMVASSSGGCLTFRFISNSSTQTAGWKATLSCVNAPSGVIKMHTDSILTCGGTFYDSGGPNCDYIPNENYTLTICPDQAGKFLKVDFDTISLPSNDLLYVYDGPSTSAPVLGIFSNFNCIDEMVASSSGGCLTFRFISNSSTQTAGWKATLSCVNAPSGVIKMHTDSILTCGGTFYDSGGPNCDYIPNENYKLTICPDQAGKYLKVDFDTINLPSNDLLYVYDGPTTASPVLGVFSNFNCIDDIVASSSGGCLTFRFTSTSSTQTAGWKATLSCVNAPSGVIKMHTDSIVTCGGTFYDSGGPNCDYIPNENYKLTICPDQAGKYLKVDFDTINLPSNDLLYVYDGPTTASPVLGVFSNFNCIDDIVASSSGGCLTFRFTSTSSTQTAGWKANLSCVNQPAPYIKMHTDSMSICDMEFYDSGGPFCSYIPNENYTLKVCPRDAGKKISLQLDTISLASNDFLYVYNGLGTTSNLATFVNQNTGCIGEMRSTTSDGCLTLRFTSTSSVQTFGWKGEFVCTDPASNAVINMRNDSISICEATFYDSGGQSCDYLNGESRKLTVCPPCPGDSIQVQFNIFYTNDAGDQLQIFDGPDDQSPQISGSPFSGLISPGFVKASNASGCLTFKYTSNGSGTREGWISQINCSQNSGQQPESSFTVQSPVNVGQASVVTFTGLAPAGSSFQWDFDGGTAQPGGNNAGPHQVVWNTPGQKTIKLKIQGSCSADSTTKSVIVNAPTGFHFQDQPTKRLLIFPNPIVAGEEFTVQLPYTTFGKVNVELFDLMGKKVFVHVFDSTSVRIKPDRLLQSGAYLLRLSNGDTISTGLIQVVNP
jgi:hypothetical protein